MKTSLIFAIMPLDHFSLIISRHKIREARSGHLAVFDQIFAMILGTQMINK